MRDDRQRCGGGRSEEKEGDGRSGEKGGGRSGEMGLKLRVGGSWQFVVVFAWSSSFS